MEAEFYQFKIKTYQDRRGYEILRITRPAKTASGWKDVVHTAFRSLDRLFTYLKEWEQQVIKQIETKEAIKIKRTEARSEGHPFKVGDIFYDSWGYDQTNVDFFQVTEITKGTVTLRAIASSWTDDKMYAVVPVPNKFTGEEFKKTPMWKDWEREDNGFRLSSRHGCISRHKEGEKHYATNPYEYR